MKKKCILGLLVAMILFSQCKKQETNIANPDLSAQSNVPVIDKAVIDHWIDNNPVAKYLTFDWSKATQLIIDGKKIVKVPTLNVDKGIAQSRQKNKVNDVSGTTISNFYDQHPPDVFFVQDTRSAKPDSLLTYMLNFVPTNSSSEFGQNNIWTGKLYDWNLNSQVLHVQELSKSTVSKKYALEYVKNASSSASPKPVVSSFWDWLGDILGDIGDFLNSVGYALGIPGTTSLQADDSSPTGYSLYTRVWGFDFGGGGSDGGGSDGGDSSYPPSQIYPGYIPGYGGGDPTQPVWDPYGGGQVLDPTTMPDVETSLEPMNLDNDPDIGYWEDNTVTYPRQPLPSYNSLYNNYPKEADGSETKAQQVAADIGGDVATLYIQNGYANACALRVSKALNYSGITIPNIQGYTFMGADGKYYFLSAAKMSNFLRQTFGPPDVDMNQVQGGDRGINFQTTLKGMYGLFVMIPNDPTKTGFNASGHVSIYSNTTCVGGINHTPFNVPGGVKHLYLWKLK